MPDSNHLFELGALAAYLLGLFYIGLRSMREVRTSVDYTIAGRQLSWIVVLSTTAATMVGGGASVGMVSQVYKIGIAAAVLTCAWHLQLIITGLWIAPRLRGMNLITIGGFFELKFGVFARTLAVVHCILFLTGALTAQISAMGTLTSHVLELPFELSLLIASAITIFYSTAGGIRAVVKTDILQCVILVAGIGTASGILFAKNNGFSGIAEKLSELSLDSLDLTHHYPPIQFISLFVAFLLGETLVPPYATRCFIAKDKEHSRWGIAGAGIFLLLFLPAATLVLGLAALVDPQINAIMASSDSQQVFPTLIRSTFQPIHPLLSGILIAAIVAAVMSSADSCLSCGATLAMEDIFRRHLRPSASDSQLLLVARMTTVVVGLVATFFAFLFHNIASILEFVYNFWAPAMILPFFVGLFWYHPNRTYAVVASMATGTLATILWQFVVHPRIDPVLYPNLSSLTPVLPALALAILAFFLTNLVCGHMRPAGGFLPSGTEEPSA